MNATITAPTRLEANSTEDTQPVLRTGSLGRLRSMIPNRRLSLHEAEGVAERQAGRLRSELGVIGPCITEADLATLPWLTIVRQETLPSSGLTTQTDFGWLIVLRGSEPQTRQRFSLAHEIKHAVDHEVVDQIYSDRHGYSAHEQAERICDRFAAALLMPRVLLRADCRRHPGHRQTGPALRRV